MGNKTKKVLALTVAILVIVFMTLKLGSYISHKAPIQGVFIGQVGKDTYVYNLSDKEVGSMGAEYMWRSLLRGAPGPFQLVSSYRIKRIEILDSDFNQYERCGSFHINVYTHFNAKQFSNLRINESCP